MRRCGATVVLLVVACVASLSLGATEPDKAMVKQVQDLAAASVREFEAGNTTKAIDLMQQSIAIMQKALTGNLAAFLPDAPEGWTAGKTKEQAVASTSAGSMQWSQVNRPYTKKEAGTRVTIELTNSPMLVQSQEMMLRSFQNPMVLQMMNQDPAVQIKLVKRDGWTGITKIETGKRTTTTLLVPGCLLTLNVSTDDARVTEQFVGLIDLKGIAKAFGGAKQPAP